MQLMEPQATGHAIPFVRHFAQLVWLLREEPADIPEQKASLRALVTSIRQGQVELDVTSGSIVANGGSVPDVSACVSTLIERLAAHRVAVIIVEASASPKDLLEVARHLSTTAEPHANGEHAPSAAFAGGPVRLTRGPSRAGAPLLLADLDITPAEPNPAARPVPARDPRVAPHASHDTRDSTASSGSAFEQFSARPATVTGQLEQQLRELDDAPEGDRLLSLLTRLATRVEHAVSDGEMALACEIGCRVARRERILANESTLRSFRITLRRLAKGRLMQEASSRLPVAPDQREMLIALLSHGGEEGADAVIEQLVAATERSHRRVYFDTLIQLQAGISSLVHMLGDSRWFVIRNAADLLGEMRASEAERPLRDLLQHGDERVRSSAMIALMRLGTQVGLEGVLSMLSDPASEMRRQAATALAAYDGVEMAEPLLRALESERDEDVQAAYLVALSRIATPDAVEQLVAFAQPGRGLFRRNARRIRLAAVQGLAKVPTLQARAALRALEQDSDAAIRRAVETVGAGSRARK